MHYAGALWSFILPFFISSIIGKKLGTIFSGIFLLINLSMVTIFHDTRLYQAHYQNEFLTVYFVVLFLILVLALIVESVRDRTQQRLFEANKRKELTEEQLHQSQRLESIGQLASGVAHEFNNILFIISGYAGLLQKRLGKSNEEEASFATKIQDISLRAADLTAKLLNFAQKGKSALAPIDINEQIRDTIEMLRHTIDRKIDLVTNLHADPCFIMADRTQMENVLINLSINARDAMPDGGVIEIGTVITSGAETNFSPTCTIQKGQGRYLQLTITDNGTGMDASVLEKVFDPFFTTKEPGKGTGLGLSSVYGIVQSHGGCIEVESVEGKGTSFRLLFPVVSAPERVSAH